MTQWQWPKYRRWTVSVCRGGREVNNVKFPDGGQWHSDSGLNTGDGQCQSAEEEEKWTMSSSQMVDNDTVAYIQQMDSVSLQRRKRSEQCQVPRRWTMTQWPTYSRWTVSVCRGVREVNNVKFPDGGQWHSDSGLHTADGQCQSVEEEEEWTMSSSQMVDNDTVAYIQQMDSVSL